MGLHAGALNDTARKSSAAGLYRRTLGNGVKSSHAHDQGHVTLARTYCARMLDCPAAQAVAAVYHLGNNLAQLSLGTARVPSNSLSMARARAAALLSLIARFSDTGQRMDSIQSKSACAKVHRIVAHQKNSKEKLLWEQRATGSWAA